jgi:hypothetical protein
MIKVNLIKPKRLESVEFTTADMKRIGLYVRQVVTERVLKGLDVQDRSMKPLSKAYAKKKMAMGQPGIRNMQLSGAMLGSMDVVSVSAGQAVVGFDRRAELVKAEINQDRKGSQWYGLSPQNEVKVAYFAERLLDNKMAKLNK